MHVQPYLNFDGRCDEALEFYKNAIGAKVGMLLRFKEAPDKSMISPGSEEKVMHSAVQVGELDRANVGWPLHRQAEL